MTYLEKTAKESYQQPMNKTLLNSQHMSFSDSSDEDEIVMRQPHQGFHRVEEISPSSILMKEVNLIVLELSVVKKEVD